MKKIKLFLTGTAIIAFVSGAVAFKEAKFNGPLQCQTTSGTCTSPTKYSVVQAPAGTLMWCGASGSCTTQMRVIVNP